MAQRSRELGVGLPDLIAPSAHSEVELSRELLAVGELLYELVREDRASGVGPMERVSLDDAERQAAKEGRELLRLRI